jgi:hypothetical protein
MGRHTISRWGYEIGVLGDIVCAYSYFETVTSTFTSGVATATLP